MHQVTTIVRRKVWLTGCWIMMMTFLSSSFIWKTTNPGRVVVAAFSHPRWVPSSSSSSSLAFRIRQQQQQRFYSDSPTVGGDPAHHRRRRGLPDNTDTLKLVRPTCTSLRASVAGTTPATSASSQSQSSSQTSQSQLINLSTVTLPELETLLVECWGYPKYRVQQVWNWIRVQGITDVSAMTNLPVALRSQLQQYSRPAALVLLQEWVSQHDGTIKRAYQCADGQVIESVLMPYEDGRYTACISSQAGCAQGCVFCATGQMGLARQLTVEEIVEQVSRFAAELQQQQQQQNNHAANVGDDNNVNKQKNSSGKNKKSSPPQQLQQSPKSKDNNAKSHGRTKRLSNVVFMGMGEPLANYRNVMGAIDRITHDLGIGARKITVSTVGIVPQIRKLMQDPNVPQIRLAVSLHCATDKERDALLPANKRYGGLDALMKVLQEYIETTGRRITLEWALIAGENDTPEHARQLGRLLTVQYPNIRRDMVHVNVIPLNPTVGYGGSPSHKARVDVFVQTLEQEFKIACTPRVRRGIDINAGCGQLKSQILREQREKEQQQQQDMTASTSTTIMSSMPLVVNNPLVMGVYDDDDSSDHDHARDRNTRNMGASDVRIIVEDGDYEDDDREDDDEFVEETDPAEVARLMAVVQKNSLRSVPPAQKTGDTNSNAQPLSSE